MNSIHNNGKDKKSLDQDLEELDLKYQNVESDEPPEMLDQAILNRAHRAVEAKNGWLDFGWIHGLTTVGLVVLTFSVVVSLRETGEFDPAIAPVSDKPLRSQSRKNASEATGELKAKKDVNVDAEHQLSEKIASPASEDESKEILESSGNRFEKQRQTPAGQTLSDDASASHAVAAPISESKNSVETTTGLERTTASGQLSQGNTAAAESDLSDLDIVDNLDLAQQTELLDIIMKHKLEGNENWKTELQTFITTYPDYPLPDELKP